jgi:myo-inositol 2-dehydrogenase/D-chiro-inositol 1-dehydrogenase
MLNFCVFGAGRIGRIHAGNVAAHPGARLACVVDPVESAAAELAAAHGAASAPDARTAFEKHAIDAVLIGSSTNTHLELITAAAEAGKAILCEKPIDLELGRVDQCLDVLKQHPVPFMVAFNRRFDPHVVTLQQRLHAGEIGDLAMLIMTSRDPAPPPIDYVKVSGGYWRDSTIHDFDLVRWLLREEPVEVMAKGSNLVDPAIGAAGDVDTAMTMLSTASGKLAFINNSRRCAYGFDQRIEAFGSTGMLQMGNVHESTVRRSGPSGFGQEERLLAFFLERHADSYRRELDAFIAALQAGRPMPTTGEDGRRALVLAEAALESHRTGRAVRVA